MAHRARLDRLVPAIVLAAAAIACGTRKSPIEPDEDPPSPSATFSRVQSEVFTPSCALSGCHAGPSPAGIGRWGG